MLYYNIDSVPWDMVERMLHKRRVSSSAAVRQAYESLYAAGWLQSRRGLFAWMLQLMEPMPGEVMLDVACGDAQFASMVVGAGVRYYGVDISWQALADVSSGYLAVADGARLPFSSGQFDRVVSVGSLEHYWNITGGVREMARVLRRGGRAYVLVPNAFGLTWTVLNAWRKGDVGDDGQPIQRFATRRAWERLLERNGLKVTETVGFERALPRSRQEWLAYLRQPREIVLALLAPFLPLNLKRSFVFVCTHSPPHHHSSVSAPSRS